MIVRNNPDSLAYAFVAANNQRMTDAISTNYHLDRTLAALTTGDDYKNPTITRLSVTLAAATDAATQLALANHLKTVINRHFADDVAHNSATSAAISTATATDAATARTLANAIKAAYNTHLSASNVHYNNDSTNTIAAADSTDAATLQTLVNELRTDFNLHVASAPVGVYITITGA